MSIANNPALKDRKAIELDEEFNNFMKRVGEVSNLVKDMAGGDRVKAEAAKIIADQYLGGKLIVEDDVTLTVKENRTLINEKAFKNLQKDDGVSRRILPLDNDAIFNKNRWGILFITLLK